MKSNKLEEENSEQKAVSRKRSHAKALRRKEGRKLGGFAALAERA